MHRCNRLHPPRLGRREVNTTHNKRRLASGISGVAIAVALTVASPAYAQTEFGTIRGHVDGAAAGAQVVAVDSHTGQRQVGTVNAQGDYEIFGLRPSTYTVSVEKDRSMSASVKP